MKKEINKPKFLNDSITKKIIDGIIPTANNDYCPEFLHYKPLRAIVVLLALVKVFIILFLFTIYPNLVYLSTDIYHQIIELTNKTRIEDGFAPLKVNPVLEKAAYDKAQDMLLNQYFAHDAPDGKRPWQWIDKEEYDYINAGENLVMNFTSAETAYSALLQSETHRKNIVNPKFTDIGVAVLAGEMNGKKTMIMVEMFGRPRAVDVQKNMKNITAAVENIKLQKSDEAQNQESNLFSVDRKEIAVASAVLNAKEIEVKSSMLNFKSTFVNNILKYSDYFMFFGLCFVILLLFLNILIKIKIQHPVIIFQSFTVIAIIIILMISKFHFFQNLAAKVIIG